MNKKQKLSSQTKKKLITLDSSTFTDISFFSRRRLTMDQLLKKFHILAKKKVK